MDTVWYFNERFGDSPSAGCAAGLVEPPAHPADGDGVSSRNVGKSLHLDAAVCWRKFHCILSPRKLQDLYDMIFCFPGSAGKFVLSFDCQLFGLDIPVGLS